MSNKSDNKKRIKGIVYINGYSPEDFTKTEYKELKKRIETTINDFVKEHENKRGKK